METQQEFYLKFSDGKLWIQDADEFGEYESEVTTFAFFDSIAKSKQFHWSLQFKAPKARRWKFSSVSTLSLAPLIDVAKEIMRIYPNAQVRMLTPYVIVHCIKD
jgi:hypothetical protein